jgi:hypothetical protein
MSDSEEPKKQVQPPQKIPKKGSVPQPGRGRVTDSAPDDAPKPVKEIPRPVNEKFRKVDE